jgi:hypothetical protein
MGVAVGNLSHTEEQLRQRVSFQLLGKSPDEELNNSAAIKSAIWQGHL